MIWWILGGVGALAAGTWLFRHLLPWGSGGDSDGGDISGAHLLGSASSDNDDKPGLLSDGGAAETKSESSDGGSSDSGGGSSE